METMDLIYIYTVLEATHRCRLSDVRLRMRYTVKTVAIKIQSYVASSLSLKTRVTMVVTLG